METQFDIRPPKVDGRTVLGRLLKRKELIFDPRAGLEVKPVPGLEGFYAAGNDGKIYRVLKQADGSEKLAEVKTQRLYTGYLYASLNIGGKATTRSVAGLVANAWLGAAEDEGYYASFKDGDKNNTRPENLFWARQGSGKKTLRAVERNAAENVSEAAPKRRGRQSQAKATPAVAKKRGRPSTLAQLAAEQKKRGRPKKIQEVPQTRGPRWDSQQPTTAAAEALATALMSALPRTELARACAHVADGLEAFSKAFDALARAFRGK
jgi:hypothetical protein